MRRRVRSLVNPAADGDSPVAAAEPTADGTTADVVQQLPDIDTLERIATPAVVRPAPRFAAFNRSSAVIGAATAVIVDRRSQRDT